MSYDQVWLHYMLCTPPVIRYDGASPAGARSREQNCSGCIPQEFLKASFCFLFFAPKHSIHISGRLLKQQGAVQCETVDWHSLLLLSRLRQLSESIIMFITKRKKNPSLFQWLVILADSSLHWNKYKKTIFSTVKLWTFSIYFLSVRPFTVSRSEQPRSWSPQNSCFCMRGFTLTFGLIPISLSHVLLM